MSDGRTTPTEQGHYQKWDVRRKREAELVYVANSEPAIWVRGGGRADLAERVPIFDEPKRTEAGRDTRRWCVLPREALLLWFQSLPMGP